MKRFLVVALLLAFLLTSCLSSAPQSTELPSVTPSSTAIIFPTDTPTPLPTVTASPTITLTPTPLPSPTPTLYVLAGTPLAPPLAPIYVENVSSVSALAEWHEPSVIDMTWTPDGRFLAVANQETVNLYDLSTREKLRTLYPRTKEIVQIAFSPDGRWFLVGTRRGSMEEGFFSTIELWLGPDWRPLGILYDVPLALSQLAFTPDSTALAMAFTSPVYEENFVRFVSTINWQELGELETGTVLEVEFFPTGGMLAVSPDRYAVRIWDFDEESWIFTKHTSFTGEVTSMDFSPDAATFGTGHYDGEIHLWDVESSEPTILITTEEVIEDIDFNPDGRIVASGGSFQNNFVRLWDVSTGALLKTLEGQEDGVTQVLFSPDSQYLVSASYNGQLILWGIRP